MFRRKKNTFNVILLIVFFVSAGNYIDSPWCWLLVNVGAVSASLADHWLRLERHERWTDDGMCRRHRHARLRWCELSTLSNNITSVLLFVTGANYFYLWCKKSHFEENDSRFGTRGRCPQLQPGRGAWERYRLHHRPLGRRYWYRAGVGLRRQYDHILVELAGTSRYVQYEYFENSL